MEVIGIVTEKQATEENKPHMTGAQVIRIDTSGRAGRGCPGENHTYEEDPANRQEAPGKVHKTCTRCHSGKFFDREDSQA